MHGPFPAPPRWSLLALRAALPRDVVGDAIVGDLHEEFADDVARLGAARARALFRRRAAGIVARALVDELCLRSWATDAPPAAASPATRAARLRLGASVGVPLLAFALVGVGIVANTMAFARVGGAAATGARSPLPPALGIGTVTLAVACIGAAAFVLCTGPRWLRRRILLATASQAE